MCACGREKELLDGDGPADAYTHRQAARQIGRQRYTYTYICAYVYIYTYKDRWIDA